MALVGPIPVSLDQVFPDGAYAAGAFEPVRDFDASSGDRFVQAKDKVSGTPLWSLELIDADPQARNRTVRAKIAAQAAPVLPSGPAGSPFVPVELTGLTVQPYVNQAGRLAYALRATGVRAPSRATVRTARETADAA